MTPGSDVEAARQLTAQVAALLPRSAAFAQLAPDVQARLWRDLTTVRDALHPDSPPVTALADPRSLYSSPGRVPAGGPAPPPADASPGPATPPPAGTAELAVRAGALLDEIDFAAFVSGLVHSTFSAVLEATVHQLEEFANLVSSVAKTVDQFTAENVTPNQARDDLAQRYPGDLELKVPEGRDGTPQVSVRQTDDFAPPTSPAWLADFGLAGRELTDELVEEELVPIVRNRIGESRLQLLATMVLLGMNRVRVSGGRISARLMFRAAARDRTAVDFAISHDPGGGQTWGTRGSETYTAHRTLVSTVGVNAQSEAALQADLYGSVELNFVSETLPLERFADLVQQSLLQRNARWSPPTNSPPSSPAAAPVPAPSPPVAEPGSAPVPMAPTVPVAAPGGGPA